MTYIAGTKMNSQTRACWLGKYIITVLFAFMLPMAKAQTCDYPAWVVNKSYAAGNIVKYSDGRFYSAKFANPGYNPTISTYYWAPYSCTVAEPARAPAAETCKYPDWVRYQNYPAQSVVRFESKFYIAAAANPGYVPTVSTFYWKPFACQSGSTSPATTPVVNPAPAPSEATSNFTYSMNCQESLTIAAGSYVLENNLWGKDGVTGPYSQCVGMGGLNADGSVSARWNWSWSAGPSDVKGYPALVYGQKPGYQSTPNSNLPKRLDLMNTATTSWSSTSTYTGTGHLAYDIWLTSDAQYHGGFLNTPITHEIMIAVEPYGGYGLNRNPAWYMEDVVIGGILYKIYKAENFGVDGR